MLMGKVMNSSFNVDAFSPRTGKECPFPERTAPGFDYIF